LAPMHICLKKGSDDRKLKKNSLQLMNIFLGGEKIDDLANSIIQFDRDASHTHIQKKYFNIILTKINLSTNFNRFFFSI
jgi:hypothetical protein